MKKLSAPLAAHIKSGATTLCWCWRLTRRDGESLGFTDHDRNLTFDGTLFEAAAGFEAGEISESIGLSVDNLEVTGAITSERLAEADLSSGLYDDASVEIFRVNWQDSDQRVLMRYGSLGEVRRAGKAFAAEVRGLSHYLQQPQGRLFQFTCDTDLGSAKCGIDLTALDYRATAAVLALATDGSIQVALSASYPDAWFTRGLATVTSGEASGYQTEIRAHRSTPEGVWLTLWQEPAAIISAGDELVVSAGCDKCFETCRERFANTPNFRGFPHMPGNDFISSYVRRNS